MKASASIEDGEMTEPTPGASARRPWLGGFAGFNAFAAWAGAIALIAGRTDFGESINDRLPFDSLVLAGLALGIFVGIPFSLLAWSAFTGQQRTEDLSLAAGLMLIGWIIGQVAVIRAFSLFQPTYLAVGVGFVIASHRLPLNHRHRGASYVVLGSILTAVGVGLVPHPLKNGLTVVSVVSIALLLAGISLVGIGAAVALRSCNWPAAIAGGVAVLVVLAAAVSVVAPAVAATSVPSTQIGTTPVDLGLVHESVELTTSDGVSLAAWYIPGTNGAGLVVMHGSGSTRSDVLDEAAVLAGGGYSVLLIDARGHGDSGGTAMDFGWYGDLDIVAGTSFLASRDEIVAGRIGVVGLSMGGEEAIGAAAADGRIRAVVAEGATARRAADKAWLSEVYGWRGSLQERIEAMQYALTDYLTEASPPTSLRSAVVDASGTRFLLITAGNVADEGHAASYIQRGAIERVTVWNVVGADHIGGREAEPDAWQQRVLEFLDESLPSG